MLFAETNATVIVASKNEVRGNLIENELKKYNDNSCWIQTDIMNNSSIIALFQKIEKKYGSLNIAFNNASSGGASGLVEDIEMVNWEKTITGCLNSIFLCMKNEIILMKKNKGGIIINNSSVDGLRAFPWDPAYSSAKHGVLGLTKSASLQYANKNIRINAICPGWIKTPPIEQMIAKNPDIEEEMLIHQPIGRFGTPEEVAELVLWLSSDKSSFMIGSVITIDGGYTTV